MPKKQKRHSRLSVPPSQLYRFSIVYETGPAGLEPATPVGLAMLIGFYTRISTLIVLNIMVVATYVHLVVHDPTVFPLQPTKPIIPALVAILSLYLLVKGGGSGSLDLKATRGRTKENNGPCVATLGPEEV